MEAQVIVFVISSGNVSLITIKLYTQKSFGILIVKASKGTYLTKIQNSEKLNK